MYGGKDSVTLRGCVNHLDIGVEPLVLIGMKYYSIPFVVSRLCRYDMISSFWAFPVTKKYLRQSPANTT